MFLNIKRKILTKRLKKSALTFLFGHMCLTENGHKRINNLLDSIKRYQAYQLKQVNTTIDEAEELDQIYVGLSAFASGTEDGLVYFENNKIVERLRNFISK